jgi:hypothetical protein
LRRRKASDSVSVRLTYLRNWFGRTLALEYHDRTIEPSIPFVPIVLPIAGLYGADHAPFFRVSIALPIGGKLPRSHAAKQREKIRYGANPCNNGTKITPRYRR